MRRAKKKERSSLYIAFFIAVGIYALLGVCVYAVMIKMKDYEILAQKTYYLSLSHFVPSSSQATNQEHQKAQDSSINEIDKVKPTASRKKKPPKAQTHSFSQTSQPISAPSSQAVDSDSDDAYARRIYALISESYTYPSYLKNKGIKGEVKLRFEIDENGALNNVKILQSSRFGSLDKLAIKSLLKASHYFPKPSANREMIITLGYGTK